MPAFLAVEGLFDADWRIAVACRENKIHTVKVTRAGNKVIVLGVWLGTHTPIDHAYTISHAFQEYKLLGGSCLLRLLFLSIFGMAAAEG